MGVIEWTAVLGVALTALGMLAKWMHWAGSSLASLVTELQEFRKQVTSDGHAHHEEHDRIWGAWQDHEERIRVVERGGDNVTG